MSTAVPASLPTICAGFPSLPDPLIPRPHFISLIRSMLDGPTDIVVIEGGEGYGKTTLAAQFSLHEPGRTFSLFVTDVSTLTRSPDYLLQVLCDQMHWFFHGVRMPDGINPEAYIRTARLQLAKRATRENKPFYFVVDGLLQLSENDPALLSLVLTDYLPVGIPGLFKFVLTGEADRLPENIQRKVPYKPFIPPGFSPEEIKTLLAEFNIPSDTLLDIATTFAGVPGKIASVRRILKAGVTSSELEQDLPRTLAELFALEWRAVPLDDAQLLDVLALLAHSKHELSSVGIASILGMPENVVQAKVKSLGFIQTGDSGIVSYVSQSFQTFAAGVFASRKNEFLQKILDHLAAASLTPDAVEHLPTYFNLLGRDADLVSYLKLDLLSAICDEFHSLQPLENALRQGVVAARNAAIPVSVFQFGFQLGILSDLSSASTLTSEIEARLALEEYDVALALAQGALLKEDRLEGLAAIVRAHVERGSRPEPNLLTEVRSLAEDVSYSRAPWRAVSVASGIIGVLPDVAIRLVESATHGSSEMPMDVALATLSLAARDLARESNEGGHSAEAISSRIQNPSLRSMTAAVALMVGDFGVEELLKQCDKLETNKDRFYLLERWTSTNIRHSEAHKVVSYALELLVRTTDYTADATTVRRLAAPLPGIAEPKPDVANKLLQMIDAQLLMLERKGPSVDYVRLCMVLVETEAAWYPDQALSRLEEICYFIAGLDVDLRLEAYAWLLGGLKKDTYKRLSVMRDTLLDTITADLRSSLAVVLGSTAEHFEVLRRTVRALAVTAPETVLEVVASVNTQDRRDALLRESSLSIGRADGVLMGAETAAVMVSMIRDETTRDQTVAALLGKLDQPQYKGIDSQWLKVMKRALGIVRAPWKATACAHAASICSRNADQPEFTAAAAMFVTHTETAAQSIDSDWDRADVGFTLGGIVSQSHVTMARALVQSAHDSRKASPIPDGRTANSYILAVKLTIRAFVGLVARQLNLDEPFLRLQRLIEHVPSHGERVRLWSDLAIRCFGWGSNTLGVKVVDEQIRPLIKGIADEGFRQFVLVDAAPCLYCAHPISALRELVKLDRRQKDKAFENITWYYLLKGPPDEPHSVGFRGLDRSDVDNIIECLKNIDTDHVFAAVVLRLCRAVNSGEGKLAFSRAERADVARRLKELSASKLPAPFGIQHEGYTVLVTACISTLGQPTEENWRKLAEDAEAIPNVADSAFVLSELSDYIPSRFDELRVECVEKARKLAGSIPAPLDRMEHLQTLAGIARNVSATLAKQCLQDAFAISLGVERDLSAQQRAIIDLADRISEDFAKSLISQMEDDPAIVKHRKEPVIRRNQINQIVRRFPARVSVSELDSLPNRAAADLCWTMLSGLNAQTFAYCSVDSAEPLVARASRMPLTEGYPILAWAIQNSVMCHNNTPFGTTHLAQLFDCCAAACELGIRLMSRAIGYQRLSSLPLTPSVDPTAEEIGAGERDRAVQLIREWLAEARPGRLIISDPYFGPADLEILKLIIETQPSCTVEVLAGEKKQRDLGLVPPYDEKYQEHWKSISCQAPPDTQIVIAGLAGSSEAPVHERYLITESGGLELGISFSGLGRGKVSKITRLSSAAASVQAEALDRFLAGRVREQNGIRIRYMTFTL